MAMLCKWSVKGAQRMVLPGAWGTRAEHMEGRLRYDAPISRWLDDFLDLWIGRPGALAEDRPAPSLTAAAA